MSLITYAQSEAGYANLWAKAVVTNQTGARNWAAKIIAAQSYYTAAATATGVPWFFIALLDMRESSMAPNTYLGDGSPLAGRFTSWTAGAIYALNKEFNGLPQFWNQIPFLLWAAEKWNGQGYFQLGVNSPYLWSWTNLYTSGKFIADGEYSASTVDPQPGVAAVLGELLVMSPAVAAALPQTAVTPPAPTTTPSTGATPVTTTPTTAAAVQDSIPNIINALKSAQSIINTASLFIPAPYGSIVSAGVPLIEDLLQTIENLKTGTNILSTVATGLQTLASHLNTIGTQLNATTTKTS